MIALSAAIFVLQLANIVFIRQLWPLSLGLIGLTALSLFVFGYILFAPARAEVEA